jgi:hypothetical protein
MCPLLKELLFFELAQSHCQENPTLSKRSVRISKTALKERGCGKPGRYPVKCMKVVRREYPGGRAATESRNITRKDAKATKGKRFQARSFGMSKSPCSRVTSMETFKQYGIITCQDQQSNPFVDNSQAKNPSE